MSDGLPFDCLPTALARIGVPVPDAVWDVVAQGHGFPNSILLNIQDVVPQVECFADGTHFEYTTNNATHVVETISISHSDGRVRQLQSWDWLIVVYWLPKPIETDDWLVTTHCHAARVRYVDDVLAERIFAILVPKVAAL